MIIIYKYIILFIIFTEKNQYVPFEKHISSCLAEIKYEIKSHTYKIDCLKEKIDFIEENLKSFKLYNRSIVTNSSNEAFADDIMFDSLISLWPLKNDDDLDEFENILLDKTKKRQCVSNNIIYNYGKKHLFHHILYLFLFYRKLYYLEQFQGTYL